MHKDPKLRRLEADYHTMLDLQSRSDIIKFKIGDSVPTNMYIVTYECRGVMLNPDTQQPCITINHEAVIYLHSDYPSQKPQLKWMTPIFHPNINGLNGSVCIQYWTPSMTIADLVIMLGNMVRYANYDIHSPLDTKAARWAKENEHRFPVDSRELCTSEVKIGLGEEEPGIPAEAEPHEVEITLL